mgnify:CR=1 FL=1
MSKIALITGITGQDGSYLAELLLKKNYNVVGIVRPSFSFQDKAKTWRLKNCLKDIKIIKKSLFEESEIKKILNKIKPDEIYHLAAQAYDGHSFDNQMYTLNTNFNSTKFILSATNNVNKKIKFFLAGSSEMFGNINNNRINENTLFSPYSAYSITKIASFRLLKNYRDYSNLLASNGILFNHESPRRGLNFVTRKITHSLARILAGKEKKIYLGDISTKRDWGHAKDYVRGIWMILQNNKPDDFVLSTGKNYSIEDYIKKVFKILDLNWKNFVKTNTKSFLRPSEVRNLKGDSTKARKILKWKPKYSLNNLCKEMLINDLNLYGMTLNDAKKIAKKMQKK